MGRRQEDAKQMFPMSCHPTFSMWLKEFKVHLVMQKVPAAPGAQGKVHLGHWMVGFPNAEQTVSRLCAKYFQ